jgi:hypothetical protein
MQANQGSHRRSLLRLRISPGFGGIILSHEVVPVWFGAETTKVEPLKSTLNTGFVAC